MGLFVAGVNPHRASFLPASQRLSEAGARRVLLADAAAHRSLAEALLLCDGARVELYAVAEEGSDAYDIAAGLFGSASPDVAGSLYFAEGIDAASHLFAALCALDEFAPANGGREAPASFPGEGPEAAGPTSAPSSGMGHTHPAGDPLAAAWQRAQAEARQAGTLGADLARLAAAAARLTSALSAAGESASAAALGETAVELARRVFGHLERRSVLVLGSGGLVPALGEAFARAGLDDFTFVGDADAADVARETGVRTAAPEGLSVVMGNADIVLVGGAVEGAALDRRLMKSVARLRRGRPMLLVDAGAHGPLIDRRAASFDDVFLYTADDLAAITRDAPWARLGTGDARERLLADAVRAFALEAGA